MNITSITDRLFLIENVYPAELVDQVLAIDWEQLPWQKGVKQEKWSRRHFTSSVNPVLTKIDQYLWDNIDYLESNLGVEFNTKQPESVWWYDEPGFDVSIHTDGHLPSAMQLYWAGVNEDYGTVFYNSKDTKDILYKFKFTPNSGYIMLNQLNEDGSQPLQWHGMTNPTPAGAYRLSSYTHLQTYKKLNNKYTRDLIWPVK